MAAQTERQCVTCCPLCSLKDYVLWLRSLKHVPSAIHGRESALGSADKAPESGIRAQAEKRSHWTGKIPLFSLLKFPFSRFSSFLNLSLQNSPA
jgi:hypothetical protein